MKKMLITGGTGFIGGSLLEKFSKEYDVYNVGRNLNSKYKNIEWNLKNNIEESKFPRKVDTIIHSGAIINEEKYSTSEYIEVNVTSTLKLIKYALKAEVKNFVYISTGGVYGFSEYPCKEDDECNPHGLYNITKYISEKLCLEYSDKMNIIILRLFFPYGESQRNRLISNLIKKIKKSEEVVLNKNGKPYINPIHIYDLTEIVKKILENEKSGILNICGDESFSIEELCYIIAKEYQVENPNIVYSDKICKNLIGDNIKVVDELKYNCQVKIEQGIKIKK